MMESRSSSSNSIQRYRNQPHQYNHNPHHHHHHQYQSRSNQYSSNSTTRINSGFINNGLMISSNKTGLRSAILNTPTSTSGSCAACRKPIRERFLLKALDQLWHEDCLKCSCCDCRLGEVGSTLFTKANLILCKRDYLR